MYFTNISNFVSSSKGIIYVKVFSLALMGFIIFLKIILDFYYLLLIYEPLFTYQREIAFDMQI